jgi:hypothetical protein
MSEENYDFEFAKYFCVYFPSDFLHVVKSYDFGPRAFSSSLKEVVLQIFATLKNQLSQLGLSPRT